MDRIHGTERAAAFRHQGKRTWDIFHVWLDGAVRDGVEFTSTVHAYVAEARPTRSRVLLFVPKGPPGDIEYSIGWGEELWLPVTEWGIASAVSLDDVPLEFFWELSAGKHDPDSSVRRGSGDEAQIRVPSRPLPLPGGDPDGG
ncbi:MAG: hypothetical protein LC733_04220 [Actinobacteria bacterium]|nr:hypothetical protein [Actinomycetota bacterium]